jgi:ubiquinone/menaquinone biosynthesis C-methylase UbiE
MDPRAYYDAFSAGYERRRSGGYHAFVDDLEAELLEPVARAGGRILEVGCGTGLILGRLAAAGARVVGADLSSGMLAAARARGFAVTQADATRLPLADARFDAVCSFKVLAHVPDARGALAEMARVLRPGGLLVAELYNRRSLRALARALRGPERVADGVTEAAVFSRYDDLPSMRALLPGGVTLERIRGVRVLTPAAFFHRLPLVGPLLRALERAAADSWLARFGGFVCLVARKRAPF